MYEYKTVPAPMAMKINSEQDEANAVHSFGEFINRECFDGWEFHSMETIMVYSNPGCLFALLGAKPIEKSYNMLVFKRKR